MVIDQVQVHNVHAIEAKDDSPIAGYVHGIESLAVAGQRMKAQAWKVHVCWGAAGVQARENHSDPLYLGLLQALALTLLVEQPKTLVANVADHAQSLGRNPVGYNT